jgi:flagellar hook-associated protein 3 FlgL
MTSFRVTQGMAYQQALASLQSSYRRLYANQAELSSGKRVRTASDDPVGAARILGYARQADALAHYRSNLVHTQSVLDDGATELQSLAELFHEARGRVLHAVNGALDASDRAAIANALDQDLTAMFGYLNSQVGGRYSFAGSRTDAPPFERRTGPDGIERVVYVGDGLANAVEVGPGVTEAGNIPGSLLLEVGPRTSTVFAGATGAQPGAGSDSGVGRARLVFAHTQTLFGNITVSAVDGPSGLRAGASSAALDTILGTGHSVSLSVDAAGAGTVSLDGGPAVAFTAADADLAVTNAAGDVVHLDFSQAVAGFSGTVQLEARGTVSLDGGQTTRPIDFLATGQQVFGQDGAVTHVDATGITRIGVEDVTYGGTFDLFNAMLAARDLLRTTGTPQEVSAALDRARALLDEMDRGEDAVLRVISAAGAASGRLTGLDERLGDLEGVIASRRSEIEDADLTTLLTDLHENEAVYQSSLLVTARLSRLSLVNFLG